MALHHLLLVEDNPADQHVASDLWETRGSKIKLHIAPDGSQALAFLHRKPPYDSISPTPDLIILDLNLPGSHGSEVLRAIKSDPVLKRIPVVVLTTSSSNTDIAKSYELHANCYLMKPLAYEDYTKLLKSIETFWLGHTELPPKCVYGD